MKFNKFADILNCYRRVKLGGVELEPTYLGRYWLIRPALLLLIPILFLILVTPIEALRIMTVGDISCNTESSNTVDSIISFLNENKVDRFVFLGDIDYGPGGRGGGSYDECGDNFLNHVKELTELRIIRGNHEKTPLWDHMVDEYDLNKNGIWHEKIKDTLLIGMNSEIPFQNQHQNVSDFLDETANHKLIFIHSPVIPQVCKALINDTNKMCGFFELYHPMFVKKGVDCVVQAHLHTMAILEKDGICYPIYGMGGATPYNSINMNKTFESKLQGFTIIDTQPDKEIHTFYSNNGTTKQFVFND
jgi:hypothetical protein